MKQNTLTGGIAVLIVLIPTMVRAGTPADDLQSFRLVGSWGTCTTDPKEMQRRTTYKALSNGEASATTYYFSPARDEVVPFQQGIGIQVRFHEETRVDNYEIKLTKVLQDDRIQFTMVPVSSEVIKDGKPEITEKRTPLVVVLEKNSADQIRVLDSRSEDGNTINVQDGVSTYKVGSETRKIPMTFRPKCPE